MTFIVFVGVVGFLASLYVHIGTFLPYSGISMSNAWPLHFTAMGVCLLLMALSRSRELPSSPLSPLLGVVFVYAALNFLIFIGSVPAKPAHNPPTARSTGHHVTLPVAIEADREAVERLTARGFSGHWMAFHLAAASAALGYLLRRREQSSADSDAEPAT